MAASDFEAEISLRYAAIRSLHGDAGRITVLRIGTEQTGLAMGNGVDPPSTGVLALGSNRTAREHFKHSPPSALELENAIVAVEDELARARRMIPDGSTLYTADAALREIATLSGAGDDYPVRLSLAALERTFDRLAAMALGRPASHEGLPTANAFAATLLILREFMHHLQFSSITLIESNGRDLP